MVYFQGIVIDHFPHHVDELEVDAFQVHVHQHGAVGLGVTHLAARDGGFESVTRPSPQTVDEVGEAVNDEALVDVRVPG